MPIVDILNIAHSIKNYFKHCVIHTLGSILYKDLAVPNWKTGIVFIAVLFQTLILKENYEFYELHTGLPVVMAIHDYLMSCAVEGWHYEINIVK